ncbi:MAG: hydroxymethylbilane synthase [Propionibacteriales bacterium]|nr:hydroxymethylbilane synthase [Propionibacteriales bacterium]
MTTLRIGTRASKLARTQSTLVGDKLAAALGVTVELVCVGTAGDSSTAPLTEIGGQGVFVGAVRNALADGRVDVAVHSLKDLPTISDERVRLAAVPERADPRDALVARDALTLGELPVGSRVGTGSPRRMAQLQALGMGLHITPIRGNVDTRLRKVHDRELDAVVLARAGLARLGREDEITETIDPIQMLPAPGQGALAVEVQAGATGLLDDVEQVLDHTATRCAVAAERALLRDLGAGCSAPVGALAEVAEGDEGLEVWLRGVVLALDGSDLVRLSASGAVTDADGLGSRLAVQMLAEGAAGLMQEQAS